MTQMIPYHPSPSVWVEYDFRNKGVLHTLNIAKITYYTNI